MNEISAPLIGGIGLPALDSHGSAPTSEGKTPVCQSATYAGGIVLDALRQARWLGARVEFVGLFGNDAVGNLLERMVREEFPDAEAIRGALNSSTNGTHDRCSHTIPLAASIDHLPPDAQGVARGWPINVVGPMSASDFPLVRHILSLSKCPLLLLSDDQLQKFDESLSLMQSAGISLLDYGQMELMAGQGVDAVCAIRWLQTLNVGNILVTLRSGCLGAVNSQWLWHPRFCVSCDVRGADGAHAFVGTLLAARVNGESWADAIRLGLAANAILSKGENMPRGLDGLRAFADGRPTVRFALGCPTTRLLPNASQSPRARSFSSCRLRRRVGRRG